MSQANFVLTRLAGLGSAIFAEVAQWKQEAKAAGRDIIDLGIGSPDQPPSATSPHPAGSLLQRRYVWLCFIRRDIAFRQAVAEWFAYRFRVQLDPEREIFSLMGSQDGLAHLALAVTNPGDYALVPDPGYPIYAAGLALAGAKPYPMKLEAKHHYLPKFEDIPTEVARQAKYMLLNYPSNPLSAVADLNFFAEAVRFAKEFDLFLVHDAAYSEMAFDGFRPPSVLEVEGAKELAVEFHSFSKSFNMAGCRLAFMVGNADVVESLRLLKSNIDYGVFHAVQEAGIAALRRKTCKSTAGEAVPDCMKDAAMLSWKPCIHMVGMLQSRRLRCSYGRRFQTVIRPGRFPGKCCKRQESSSYLVTLLVKREKGMSESR